MVPIGFYDYQMFGHSVPPTRARAPVASLVASLDDDVCLDAIDVFPRRERGAVGE